MNFKKINMIHIFAFSFSIGILFNIFAMLNYIGDLSSQRDAVQLEYDMSQIELNIATEELKAVHADNKKLKNDLIVMESQIEIMKDEVQKVKDELDKYEYRELWYRNINLSEELQEYIYNWCEELGLDYDIALAKMKLESQFNIDARGYNRDLRGNVKSTDYGIGQVNSKNLDWVNELCEREVDVVNNVYDNIEASLRIYNHYRTYWSNKGHDGLELEIRALNSYNRGIVGYLNYMNNGNGYNDWRYAKLVIKNLEAIR